MRSPRLLALVSAALWLACPKPTEETKAATTSRVDVAPTSSPAPRPTTSTSTAVASGAPSSVTLGAWAESKAINAAVMESAVQDLSKWIDEGARDPKNAWAMAHGLFALGKDSAATDGREMIDVIVHDYAERQAVGGKSLVLFPKRTPDGRVAEAHSQLMIKSMIEAGVAMNRVFELRDGSKVSMEELVRSAAASVDLPSTPEKWRDFAWSASALLQGARQVDALFAQHPRGLTEAKLAETMLGYTVQEQSFLEPFMKQGRPDLVQKRKQHIFAHQCGGLHVVQAGLQAAATLGKADAKALAKKELEIVLFRHQAERVIYEAMLAQSPQYEILLLVQELKFHGHVLETLALGHRLGLLERTPELERQVAQVVSDVLFALKRLAPHYGKLTEIRKIREQTYLDMIGDGCHAIRGLREASVAFFAPS